MNYRHKFSNIFHDDPPIVLIIIRRIGRKSRYEANIKIVTYRNKIIQPKAYFKSRFGNKLFLFEISQKVFN